MNFRTLKLAVTSTAMLLALGIAGASAQDVLIGLVTKTDNNPFFVKMKEGAEAKAKELGVTLQSFAGKFDGDNDTQVTAVETLISAGAKGILITPSDTKAIVPTIERAAKREFWSSRSTRRSTRSTRPMPPSPLIISGPAS
jgi:fructose transport system substrate-binding protein